MQFPEIITRMPQAKLPVSGLKAHVMRSEHGLVAFFEATDKTEIPPHSHKAQWGTVLEGEVEFTVGGETRICRPGDSYYIESGVIHSAVLPKGAKLIEFFEEADRFELLT